jgi:hypothetical protein
VDGRYAYQAYTKDGKQEHFFYAPALTPLLPQDRGYHSVAATIGATANGTSVSGIDHKVISGDGVTLRTTPLSRPGTSSYRWNVSGIPHGGSLAVVRSCSMSCGVTVRRFASDGTPGNSALLGLPHGPSASEPESGVGAVSAAGDTLVLLNDSGRRTLGWITPDGVELEIIPGEGTWHDDDRFQADVLDPNGSYLVRPLLDGSVVLQEDGAWTRWYGYHATSGQPAPDWLASRDGWSFRWTRGARGYAFFQPADQIGSTCDQEIELVAPSGRLCAAVFLHSGSQACWKGIVDQGWDGTVVQSSSSCTGAHCTCSYRWWTRLLAGP